MTTLELSEELSLTNGSTASTNTSFKGLHVIVAPGVDIQRFISDMIFLRGTLRYDMHVTSKLSSEDEGEAYLVSVNRDPVVVDWSGFRVGLGIGIQIN